MRLGLSIFVNSEECLSDPTIPEIDPTCLEGQGGLVGR